MNVRDIGRGRWGEVKLPEASSSSCSLCRRGWSERGQELLVFAGGGGREFVHGSQGFGLWSGELGSRGEVGLAALSRELGGCERGGLELAGAGRVESTLFDLVLFSFFIGLYMQWNLS